ncbi:hypothetical protein D9M71_369400 [compost metagenome]
MYLEDGHPSLAVRTVDHDLAVEAAGAQQRRVEDFRAVGGGQQHHAFARVEAVQFGEQLVEGLLLLVVAAEGAHATHLAQRIQLVDEDDAGRRLTRLLEQVADPRGADADEHLDEFRTGNGEKWHAGLAGHRLGHQGLAGAGRADQQDALGNPCAEAAVLGLVFEEGDDFLQLGLGLVDAGDIVEGHPGVALHVHLGLGLADADQAAEALLVGQTAEQEAPEGEDQHQR